MFKDVENVNPKILLVDDLEQNIYALQEVLKTVNIQVDTAFSGNEALLLMTENVYAAVLLDVQMPDMNGYEVAKYMRGSNKTKDTPIIFITAINKEKAHVYSGYQLGAFDYLFKPVDPEILRSKVKIFIDLYKSLAQLKKAKNDIEVTLNAVSDSVLTVNKNCIIQYCNITASKTIAYDFGRYDGYYLFDVLKFRNKKTGQYIDHEIKDIIENCKNVTIEDKIEVVNDTGKVFVVELSIVPMLNIAHEYMGVVFTIHDISFSEQLTETIHFNATHDMLTEIPNRFHFNELLGKIITTSNRYAKKFAVLFIDIDDFKQVNDQFGHECGDILLKTVVQRVLKITRNTDLFARIGGDEFIVVLENISHANNVSQVAQLLVDEISKAFIINENEIFIGVSIGIAMYPEDGTNVETLVRNADFSMYLAKEQGKNTFCFFEKELQKKAEVMINLNHDLRKAIKGNDLTVFYQPQYSLQNNCCCGAEALVRWKKSDTGFVSPADFVKVAENSGLIRFIGCMVLKESCSRLHDWHSHNIRLNKISVNISSLEFYDKTLSDRIIHCIEENDLNPNNIEIEITENIAFKDEKKFIAILHKLKEIGLHIAIDDFGTGYSNLGYLKSLPIDVLKIDQCFIKNMLVCTKDQAIVKTILELGRQLGIDVVSEGVETQQQFDFLKAAGCQIIQGYLYAKPMSHQDIIAFLQKNDSKMQA